MSRLCSRGLVHDDYHDNNLLVEGERVTALLDWDGCHPDWLLLDLSNAIWEFCHDDEAHTLDPAAAQSIFTGIYCGRRTGHHPGVRSDYSIYPLQAHDRSDGITTRYRDRWAMGRIAGLPCS